MTESQQSSTGELFEIEPVDEPFITYPCDDCDHIIELMVRIDPGQVAVLSCDNCGTSWTFYNPSLIIRKTSEIPEDIQERTWGVLSQ